MEDLTLAIVERTDIASFSSNMVYDLMDDTDAYDDNFFVRTPDGPRLMPSVVPDKTRFTQFAQRIADIRSGGRSECDVKVRIGGVVDFRASSLLEASYRLTSLDSDLASTRRHRPDSVNSGLSAGLPLVDESQVDFRLDKSGHEQIQRRVTCSYEAYYANMSEDSDMAEDDEMEDDDS